MNVRATGPARELLDVILDGPHDLVLSEFLLTETARVLGYPRMGKLYSLTDRDIREHLELLRERSDLVDPMVESPVVLADPNGDPVLYTAVVGRADVLCTLDRDFYAATVLTFCQARGIDIMDDVELLRLLRRDHQDSAAK
jgi:putative PIN family toxin of toxin-antitoxin system